MNINKHLLGIAEEIKALGEAQQALERELIKWKKGENPFDDFKFYVALSAVWQTSNKNIESDGRTQEYAFALYDAFLYEMEQYKLKKNKNKESEFVLTKIKDVLKEYKSPYFMSGVNIFELWVRLMDKLEEDKIDIKDPLEIQSVAKKFSTRTQHWIVYAPLEAALVVGDIFELSKREIFQIIPPLGSRVLVGFEALGLKFTYPPIKKELDLIKDYLIFLAEFAETNHLIIEMGIWRLGKRRQ